MNRATFFKHFDLLADQPDAVAKMRELILNLAVRGKLVPQNPKDEPAESLLERIRAARARLHNEGKVKTKVEIAPIAIGESPYSIPSSWVWIPLNEIIELVYGKLLPTSELLSEGFDVFGANGIIGKYSRYHYEDEMLLISCRGAYSGTPNISPRQCYVTNNSIVCEFFDPALCDIRFFHAVISVSPREKIVTGTAQPQVTVANAIKLPVPLPPLAEQRRIVAKVDELMALCDELAARQQARHAARAHLQQSALHHLLTARDPHTFAPAWQRARDHFHLLHDTPDALPQLRQAILRLAVQGRLVPQNPKDEPAEKLLRDIAIKTKHSNFENGSDETDWAESLHNPPFELPASWRWARFDKIATIASNLVQPAKFASLPHVAPDNIEKGTGRLLPYRTVKEDDVRSANHRFFPGQIVYSKIRPNLSKAVVVDFEGLCSADMYPINSHINADYLLRYILSQTFLDMAVRNDTRVAMPKINQEELNRVLVAVPPLAEQKRIVARVEALLGLCDALAAQLHQTRTLGAHLLDSTLHHLLAA